MTELVQLISGFSTRTNVAICVNLLDEFYRKNYAKCLKSYGEFEQYKQLIYDLLQNDGIIVLPATISVAPFHHGVGSIKWLLLKATEHFWLIPITVRRKAIIKAFFSTLVSLQTLCAPPVYFGFSGLINILGLPATMVPMGLDSRGMPLSVQVRNFTLTGFCTCWL